MLVKDSDTQRRDTSYDNLSNIDIQYNFSRFSFLTIKLINDKIIHLGTSQGSHLVTFGPSNLKLSNPTDTKVYVKFFIHIYVDYVLKTVSKQMSLYK